MIEKCAAVLFEWFDDEYQGAYRPSFSDLSDSEKEMYLNVMREVFEVMKEPSNQMLEDAGCINCDNMTRSGLPTDHDHLEWWQAMVSAALGEQEE